MKRNIIIMTILALMGLWIPTYASAEDGGTHGADFTGEDWGGDIDLGFNFTDEEEENTAGVENISETAPVFKVMVERGEVVVISSSNRLLPIYNLNGAVAAVAQIQSGRNVLDIPSSGIYFIGGKKIAL